MKKIKLLFCGHDQKFIKSFIEYMKVQSYYDVRVLEHKGHVLDDLDAAKEGLAWADIIFCEWALGNAVWFSEHKRVDQCLVIRLHLQEIQARNSISYIWQTHWEKVDRLILITHHCYDFIQKTFPILRPKSSLIYNPIPAKTLLNHPKDINKSSFTLGFVGAVPARKRLDLAIDLLRILRRHDHRYVLRIKGSLPKDFPWMMNRKDEMNWYNSLFSKITDLENSGAVIFESHGSDMSEWYRDIGWIISTSDFEGSHQAVAEGMASGCIPIIRDWVGSDRIYPPKFVMPTVEGMASKILEINNLNSYLENSEFCRHYSHIRFDDNDIHHKLESILCQEFIKKDGLVESDTIAQVKNRALNLFSAPNIAIIAYIPINSAGGYRIRVEQEIQILKQLGCTVHLICIVPKDGKDSIDHIKYFERIGAITHILLCKNFFSLSDLPEFSSIRNSIKDIISIEKINVIHAEALYCARLVIPLKVDIPNILFSVDWHGILPEESRMGGASQARIKMLETEELNNLKQADLNIFVSNKMNAFYKHKYGLTNLNQAIVPCCLSDDKFSHQFFGEDKVDYQGITFGYIGTMTDWQCGKEMIQMFSKLRLLDRQINFKLLVPEVDHEKVRELCHKFDLDMGSIFLKEVPHNEVQKNFQDVTVAVLLRKYDPVNIVSSPTKYGEYLAAGKPVLMTDCIGDYSEHAERNNIGLIIPGESLEDAIIDPVYLDSILAFARNVFNKHYEFSLKCKTSARDYLSWEPVASEWLSTLRTVHEKKNSYHL